MNLKEHNIKIDLGGRKFNNEDNLKFQKVGLAPDEKYIVSGILKVVFADGTIDEVDYEVEIKANELYNYRQGIHIQNAFPNLHPMDREFLMTGTYMETPKEDEADYITDDGSWVGR